MVQSCPSCASLCGVDAKVLVRTLAKRCDGREVFSFKFYKPRPGIAQRLKICPPRKLFSMTVDELWKAADRDIDALVGRLIGGKKSDGTDPLHFYSAHELSEPDFRFPDSDDDEVLAICSRFTRADGSVGHLPMLDFRAEACTEPATTARTLELIAKALIAACAPDGVVLDSGNSYHYYGFDLVTEVKWRKFMLNCLLLEPIVDVRYIAHRLLSGGAALRITSSSEKPMPHVVTCIRQSSWTCCAQTD